MPPKKKGGKKGGKKKKKVVAIDPTALTEVDRTFYELTITDLNRKLARLRSLTAELETKNEELTTELAKVDEDRSDIIVYLKRMLQEKSDEIKEVQDRLTALEETRQNETEEFEQKIEELEAEYKQMQETLTSEIKLLEGKLNALEEFRVQRDELMRKYEQQEVQMDEQEKRHKRELYETEKKFIIGKDKLKKEMEARLLQLSTEFHDATELRIASTTHRVIRENIAINNELEIMLATHKRLHSEGLKMRERDKTLRQKAEIFEAETKKTLAQSRTQVKVIERMTQKTQQLKVQEQNYIVLQKQHNNLIKLKEASDSLVRQLQQKVGLIEQNLHASLCDRAKLEAELLHLKDENANYVDIIYGTVNAIREAIFVSESDSDESIQPGQRESLLNNILTMLSTVDEKRPRKVSAESICSVRTLYTRGDLGFVPKPVVLRSRLPTKRNVECQTGSSLEASTEEEAEEAELGEDMLRARTDSETKVKGEELSEELGEEKSSILFFDDRETVDEESEVSVGSKNLQEFLEEGEFMEPSTGRTTTTAEPLTTETDTTREYFDEILTDGEMEMDETATYYESPVEEVAHVAEQPGPTEQPEDENKEE